MSQPQVERAIGRLATDEEARRTFIEDPREALLRMAELGIEMTEGERLSLASLDPEELARFARAINPRLQRIDPRGGDR